MTKSLIKEANKFFRKHPQAKGQNLQKLLSPDLIPLKPIQQSLKRKLNLAIAEIDKYLKPQGLIEVELFKSRKTTVRHILSILQIFGQQESVDNTDFLNIIQFLSSFYLSLPEKNQLAHHLEAALTHLLDGKLVTTTTDPKSVAAELLKKTEVYFQGDHSKKTIYLDQQERLITKIQEINKLDEIKSQFFFTTKKPEINKRRFEKFNDVMIILDFSERFQKESCRENFGLGKR